MALPKAFKVLTKAEIKHLKEDVGVTTISGFKRTAMFHVEMRKENAERGYPDAEPCWTCKHIAIKLGLEV